MNSIKSVLENQNRYLDDLTEYVNELKIRAGDKMLDKFSEMRQFSMETIKENDIFYIGDATEMLIPSYINKVESFGVISPTNKKPIFHNRFVMPIKDVDGKVLNLVGYSKEADERYVKIESCAEKQDAVNKKFANDDTRIKLFEQKFKTWEWMLKTIVAGVLGTLLTSMLSLILK